MDLLLDHQSIASLLAKGGMEHDLLLGPDQNRIYKVTRAGVFGLTPGIELDLVPEGEDGRRFHLWEATPALYLDRLQILNELVPGLNQLEGVIQQPNDVAICISQPRFEIIPVSEHDIEMWFGGLGFTKIADAAFYREEDNLGIFGAHDKNLVRESETGTNLIPFDVIPVRPDRGFRAFIGKNRVVRAERITRTTSRATSPN